MAAELFSGEVAADGPVDLLVFAFAVPDVAPWRNTAPYLSHLCPGEPFAFAVCDQGVAAPFTALRLIREYASTGGCQRAMLVVAEQAAMPYQPAVPAATPARHAVVALLCDQSGPGRLDAVRVHVGVAPLGQPCTGVWWEVAGRLPEWAERRVLLADYDPVLGHLCLAAIEVYGGRA
jgi:hypothetical protein